MKAQVYNTTTRMEHDGTIYFRITVRMPKPLEIEAVTWWEFQNSSINSPQIPIVNTDPRYAMLEAEYQAAVVAGTL